MQSKNWFGISVVLNLVLMGAVLHFWTARNSARPATIVVTTNIVAPAERVEALAKPIPRTAGTNANEPQWRQWLDQLRAAGVPDNILAGVVSTDFEARWDKRRRELQAKYNRGELDDNAMSAFEQQHDVEQEKEMRAALGNDGFTRWDRDNKLSEFDLAKLNLTPTETDALYALKKDLTTKQRELEQEKASGQMDDADFNDKQTAIQKDYDDQLKTLLGQDRYASMQAPDDSSLRRSLKNLNANDQQFQAVLEAQKQWNDRRAELERASETAQVQGQAYDEQMRAIDAARDAEYQRVLGTNGFDEFQKAQDANYQTLKRFATNWQLSDSDVDYVYRSLQYYQKSVQDYQQQAQALEQQGQQVDWSAVQTNIQQFSDQMGDTLQKYLGDDRFQKLKRNNLLPGPGN